MNLFLCYKACDAPCILKIYYKDNNKKNGPNYNKNCFNLKKILIDNSEFFNEATDILTKQ